jgi:hypothetical protein
MGALLSSLIVFACVSIGWMLGMLVGSRLPTEHMSSDSKDVLRLGMGLVATTVALVLGLLVASAKSFYDSQNNEVTQLAANIVLLDRVLAHYGPEATDARAYMHSSAADWSHLLEPGGGLGRGREFRTR